MIVTYEETEILGGVLVGNYHPEGHTYKFKTNNSNYFVCPLYNLVDIYEGPKKIKRVFYKSKSELIKILQS